MLPCVVRKNAGATVLPPSPAPSGCHISVLFPPLPLSRPPSPFLSPFGVSQSQDILQRAKASPVDQPRRQIVLHVRGLCLGGDRVFPYLEAFIITKGRRERAGRGGGGQSDEVDKIGKVQARKGSTISAVIGTRASIVAF